MNNGENRNKEGKEPTGQWRGDDHTQDKCGSLRRSRLRKAKHRVIDADAARLIFYKRSDAFQIRSLITSNCCPPTESSGLWLRAEKVLALCGKALVLKIQRGRERDREEFAKIV